MRGTIDFVLYEISGDTPVVYEHDSRLEFDSAQDLAAKLMEHGSTHTWYKTLVGTADTLGGQNQHRRSATQESSSLSNDTAPIVTSEAVAHWIVSTATRYRGQFKGCALVLDDVLEEKMLRDALLTAGRDGGNDLSLKIRFTQGCVTAERLL